MPPKGFPPARQRLQEEKTMTTPRTVLITGTSSGIGLATAVAAATAGWNVIATLRDTSRADALRAAADAAGVLERVQVARLDVTDSASIAEAVSGVIAEHGRLDAVINNAGVGQLGTVEQIGVAPFRSVMEVNFFGVVELTLAALPHLRAVGGRVVTVSSLGGVVGQPFNEAYCAAKFAVEGFLESLAPVAATTGVSVSVVEPGPVASEFVASLGPSVPGLIENAGPYAAAFKAYSRTTEALFDQAQSSADAAAAVLGVLTAEQPVFRVQTSGQARELAGIKLADVDGSAVQAFTSPWLL
ncbi:MULTISPECIES: SDR family NAD(P)-dependent oxidoreductase [Streptomyces]|uniref:SDR family NAD(P)-dependent oxidoreductase n=1 Tax=Streptomyces glycanivorans TaxID=3033808 RepID=A0ABY9JMH1_9ACTN|nr:MULTISPECIES: SDR family NAD(P)-dependent oxidoreductase [unclassified Streptomyces]WLQ68813.1 SDR family NAD(P)-dependent oxidoreductase [Streptomyces sp. Alt3]WSQ82187.1 SDR family NAD(P)-dependent oxidoreductase [Streptomyces sp. NBC_01213]WSR11164.1 SDR family NAD(P)-dependent oxidoreductase [Streptomyces sp. NBC_01208]